MKNKLKHFCLFLASAAALTSCMPDPEEEALVYKGPGIVEFKNHTLGVISSVLDAKGIARTAGFTQTDSSRTVLINKRVTDTVFVQLVGPHRGSATDLNFDVQTTSTAVEGVHYSFRPAGNKKVIIPENSSRGIILVDVIPNSLIGTETVKLSLSLQGNQEIKPSKNYDSFHITFKR
jgi:hypothetical protein